MRERKQREKGKAGGVGWILPFLLIRATLVWVPLNCHELATKLIVNNKSLDGGLGFASTA